MLLVENVNTWKVAYLCSWGQRCSMNRTKHNNVIAEQPLAETAALAIQT